MMQYNNVSATMEISASGWRFLSLPPSFLAFPYQCDVVVDKNVKTFTMPIVLPFIWKRTTYFSPYQSLIYVTVYVYLYC